MNPIHISIIISILLGSPLFALPEKSPEPQPDLATLSTSMEKAISVPEPNSAFLIILVLASTTILRVRRA